MGCAPNVPLQRLQAFIGLLQQCDVELEPSVEHLPSALQLRRLRAGQLDLGLLLDAGPAAGVEFEPLYRGEPFAVVVPIGHPVVERDARVRDFGGDVLLVVPRAAEPQLHSDMVALAASDGTRSVPSARLPGPIPATFSSRSRAATESRSRRVRCSVSSATSRRP